MPLEVAVSIINYRTAELTLQCIRSVLDDMDGLEGMVVVVDNFSNDGSTEQIETWIASQPAGTPVRLVRSPVNSGFSGGHNQGIKAVDAETYLVLNSDAVLRPGFLRTLLGAHREMPDIGLLAPVIEYNTGGIQNSCFRFPGPLSELVRSARSGIVTRLFSRHDVALGPDPDPESIEWVSFACVLLSGRMVRDIGPMDEGYFLYFEDAEYCLRAARAGWGIRQIRTARLVHFRGGSGPVKTLYDQRARMPRYYYSSRTRFLYQAHGMGGLIATNLLWYVGRVIKHSYRLVGRPVGRMVQAAGRDIWINVLRPLGPRYAPGEAE